MGKCHPCRYANPTSSHRNLPLTPLSAVVGSTLANRYNQQNSRLQTSNEVLDYNNGPAEVLDPPMRAPSPLGLDYTNNYPNDPPPRGMTYDYPSSVTFGGGNRGVQQVTHNFCAATNHQEQSKKELQGFFSNVQK